MIRLFACSIFLLWASTVSAFEYPALHSVNGVAADDVLNIRENPSASSPVVSDLKPNETGLEVIKTTDDGRWGLINVTEGIGWVAMRYLSLATGSDPKLRCYGTEPFWGASLRPDASFALADEPAQDYQVLAQPSSTNRTDRFSVIAQNNAGRMIATVNAQQCSDGMSDRTFGLSVELLIQDTAGWNQYSSCCSLSQ